MLCLCSQVEFEEVKPTPTMQIDRRDDKVYHDTMMVVKSVLQANQAILKANSNEILGHVKVSSCCLLMTSLWLLCSVWCGGFSH